MTEKQPLYISLSIEQFCSYVGHKPFLVEFTKKDGTLRQLLGKIDYLERPDMSRTASIPHLLTVRDLEKDGFSTINLNTISFLYYVKEAILLMTTKDIPIETDSALRKCLEEHTDG